MTAKPDLILLPGLNCTRRLWQAQIVALDDRASIRVPDVAGHESLADLAQAILAEAPRRFSLAGLSMGGYVALEIMRRAPERVERLALVDTQARADDAEAAERRHSMIRLARDGRFETILPTLWARLVAPERASDAALEAVVRSMALKTGADGFIRQQNLILGRPDSRPDLPAIKCPVLVIVGEKDILTPVDRAREMADAIGGARLEIIPGAGHLAPLEAPAAVSALLDDWLDW